MPIDRIHLSHSQHHEIVPVTLLLQLAADRLDSPIGPHSVVPNGDTIKFADLTGGCGLPGSTRAPGFARALDADIARSFTEQGSSTTLFTHRASLSARGTGTATPAPCYRHVRWIVTSDSMRRRCSV
jgi:hypothetical protein